MLVIGDVRAGRRSAVAIVWFRCPICGFQMQGDPRFPPLCPNTANHPQALPGQPLQPVVILPPRPLSWRERYLAYNRRRQIRGLKALGILFLIGLVCIVVLVPIYFILSIIDPARPGAPSLI